MIGLTTLTFPARGCGNASLAGGAGCCGPDPIGGAVERAGLFKKPGYGCGTTCGRFDVPGSGIACGTGGGVDSNVEAVPGSGGPMEH